MKKNIKNIEHSTVLSLADQVAYQPGQITSKTLAQNPHHNVTLFAFELGEGISTHESDGDALITVLEGTGKITIDSKDYLVHAGESIVMPARVPHTVYAVERFKMLLTVLFPADVEKGENA